MMPKHYIKKSILQCINKGIKTETITDVTNSSKHFPKKHLRFRHGRKPNIFVKYSVFKNSYYRFFPFRKNGYWYLFLKIHRTS